MQADGKKAFDYDSYEKREKSVYSKSDYLYGRNNYIIKFITAFTIFMAFTSLFVVLAAYTSGIKGIILLILISLVITVLSYLSNFVLERVHIFWKILFIIIPSGIGGILLSDQWLYVLCFCILLFVMGINIILQCAKPAMVGFTNIKIITSVICVGLAQSVIGWLGEYIPYAQNIKTVLGIVGMVYFVVGMYALTRLSLYDMAATYKDDNVPTSLKRGTYALMTGFISVIVIIAYFDKIKTALYDAFVYVLLKLLSFSGGSSEEVPGEQPSNQLNRPDLGGLAEDKEPSLFAEIMEKIFIVIVGLLLLVILYFIIRAIIRGIKRIIINLKDYLDELNSIENKGYEDEEESTLNIGDLSKGFRDAYDKLRHALTPKPRINDMENDEAKIRLIYRYIKDKLNKKTVLVSPSATPKEMLDTILEGDDSEQFIHAYQKARYSTHKVKDDDVKNGRKIMKNT